MWLRDRRARSAKLKRQMIASGRSSRKTPPAAFIELLAASESRSGAYLPEYTLELEGRDGKLRNHCKAGAAAELATERYLGTHQNLTDAPGTGPSCASDGVTAIHAPRERTSPIGAVVSKRA